MKAAHRERMRKWGNWGANIAWGAVVAALCYVAAQVFLVATFRIPSDSMSPTLIKGDVVMVWKPTVGARLFDVFAALRGEEVNICRLPGWRDIRHNDVLVFNFPYAEWDKWDKMEMQIAKYYIKRCIAVPGDTLYVADGIYQIAHTDLLVGNIESQKSIMRFDPDHIPAKQYLTLPFDSLMGWNIRDFGPMYIPGKDDSIPMNRTNYLLYKKLIEWEQHDSLTCHDEEIWLRGSRLEGYRFRHNYYFMGGDDSMNSVDSRYWGLIPEEFIVGKAALILKSTDPRTGKLRLNRLWKRIK